MKRFSCRNCGNEVYFDSTRCVNCGNALGFNASRGVMLSTPQGRPWSVDRTTYHLCANAEPVACNWLVREGSGDALCRACAHNRTIPDLSDPEAISLWRELELAKRYLFYSIIRWNLPQPTMAEDPDHGLAFDFLADQQNADGTVTPVLTGHADGLITINIAEGDDAERERRRTDMGEPYRTLVGHMRHEVGHYYWDRLVRDAGKLDAYRAVFGDEREDYNEALKRHYEQGPPADWANSFISTYATAHPWEDWAETFAHYIHIVDALETAAAFGIRTTDLGQEKQTTHAVDFDPYTQGTIGHLLKAWVPVTVAMNAINRSMGQPDLYPFVLSTPVEQKLGFVHRLIRAHAQEATPAHKRRWWRLGR
ncbi:putative zinc-binding peptidase [Acuticoccus sp. I52.16.1]|nr:putative zinc-binding peptidase [Acuticoccus sp. I52.16.1]UOM36498.1 putative zinc-binding peptidase [Acuticoccus sp. I52.16.1]